MGYYGRSYKKTETFGVGSSFLHWIACLSACVIAVVAWSGLNLTLSKISSSKPPSTPDNKDSVTSNVDPFAFYLVIFILAGFVSLCIYAFFCLLQYCIRLPESSIIQKRLKEGRSSVGRWTGYALEQFSNSMVEGKMGSPHATRKVLVLAVGTVSFYMLNGYLWISSLKIAEAPFVQTIQCLYVLLIPLFSLWVLHEPLHGLRAIAGLLCFIGAFLHLFAKHEKNSKTVQESFLMKFPFYLPLHSNLPLSVADRFLVATEAVGYAIIFASYMVFYKYLNPVGNMLKIVAYQGIGGGLIGIILYTLTKLISTDTKDILQIFINALSTFKFHITPLLAFWIFLFQTSVNQALRWGQPMALGTALVLVPCTTTFLTYARNETPNFEHISGSLLVLTGFSLEALYQFVVSSDKRKKRKQFRKMFEDEESNEELLMGGQYVL